MVDVSVSHIIGTAALIGLVISVALAYQIIVGYVENNVFQSQLKQTAEYVSMNIANQISLTEFTYGILSTGTVTKKLDLPKDLSGKTYVVRLISESGNYYVEAQLTQRRELTARAPIPIHSTTTPVEIIDNITKLPENGLTDSRVTVVTEVYGGDPNIVIWCERLDKLYIGLGRMPS